MPDGNGFPTLEEMPRMPFPGGSGTGAGSPNQAVQRDRVTGPAGSRFRPKTAPGTHSPSAQDNGALPAEEPLPETAHMRADRNPDKAEDSANPIKDTPKYTAAVGTTLPPPALSRGDNNDYTRQNHHVFG